MLFLTTHFSFPPLGIQKLWNNVLVVSQLLSLIRPGPGTVRDPRVSSSPFYLLRDILSSSFAFERGPNYIMWAFISYPFTVGILGTGVLLVSVWLILSWEMGWERNFFLTFFSILWPIVVLCYCPCTVGLELFHACIHSCVGIYRLLFIYVCCSRDLGSELNYGYLWNL